MKKFIVIAATALTMCTMITAPATANKDGSISSSNAPIIETGFKIKKEEKVMNKNTVMNTNNENGGSIMDGR